VKCAGRLAVGVMGATLALLAVPAADSFPVSGSETVLPTGTELNEDALDQPRELFHSEATSGHRSYLVDLGDMAFGSPLILGGAARKAGISCETCHINATTNAKLFIPGLSSRAGNFDTAGALFNPKANHGVLDPVTVPSLRGTRYLAPYGHNGRTASLRDFVRNAIVNEFAGPEPSPAILDAIVTYLQDIDFLPNPRIDANGRLTESASASERRGEALFSKPFPLNAQLSCATCHVPSAAFVDHVQHDVGAGLFKTPTLLNADFNGPYFHDGRYDTFDQVVQHFDRQYHLDLSEQDHADLVAYLTAVGDGERAYEPDSLQAHLDEINHFTSVLDTAIPAHDQDIIALTVDSVGIELRELTDQFPERKDSTVAGGKEERAEARARLQELVLQLRRVELAAAAGHFDQAATAYTGYNSMMTAALPSLKAALPWSLFDPDVHKDHYAGLRQVVQAAKPSQ
jgi:hypothetical protein